MKKENQESKIGLFYGISAFVLWGLFPIYFKQLSELSCFEVVSHRIIWSVPVLYILLKLNNKKRLLKFIISNKKIVILLFITGVLMATNWTIYIYAVNINQIVEASLGAFITPIVSMFFGRIVLKETLTKSSKIAISIVFIAILIQIYDIGKLPFISLFLPITFGTYSLIRKSIKIPSLEGLFLETMLLFPIAMAILFFIYLNGNLYFEFSWFGLFISLAGPATVLPLLLFNSATMRLKLTTIGYIQYITPSISLCLAIFLYDEPINKARILSFILIWIALAIVTTSSIYKNKKAKI